MEVTRVKIQNPVLKGFNPDPSICRVGDDYYIAVSTFEWFPGVQIHHSKDLKNWHLVAQPLNRTSLLDMKGNPDSGGIWAPCLSYADGKFWLIYTDVKVVNGKNFKDCYNYLTTCETVDGEWSEPVFLNCSGFDASLFHDTNGKKYLLNMLWDYRMTKHRFHGISMQEYNDKDKKLVGEAKIIFKGTNRGLTEAPHLYHIGDYYYLMVAEGGTVYEHCTTLARSKDINGPYEVHPENPMLTSYYTPANPIQKAGHSSLVETDGGEWYLAHLMGRPLKYNEKPLLDRGYCPLGRETGIQKIYWENDWPYVVGGPAPSEFVDMPNLKEVVFEAEYREHEGFDEEKLPMCFQTLRVPFDSEIGSLSDRKGHLRLYGRESWHSLFTQAYVARRWQSFKFTAETKMEFEPTNFQQSAGMTCFYNTHNWSAVQLSKDEEKGKIIYLVKSDKMKVEMPLEGKEILVPEDVKAVYFKVVVEEVKYFYEYSFDGVKWNKIDVYFDSLKLSDDYINQEEGGGFFTGAFVGMNCIDLTGNRTCADFDYFKYIEED